jgi:CelD/BcsL family acetyltransferase involved in cellulose biosynthesis
LILQLLVRSEGGYKTLQIHEINTKKQFYKMRKHWNNTLNESLENNIFLTWEKMAPSVNRLEKENQLKILYATDSDKLVGIAPFRKSRRSLKGHLNYDVIEPLTNGDTDYTGIILAKQGKQILHKFLTYLFNQKDWDLMLLPDIPQTSPTLELLKHTSKLLPKSQIEKGIICPYLTIPNSEQKLLANLNIKFRKNLQRRLRKIEREHGNVELKEYYELGSLEQAMEILFKLHQKRWTSKTELGRFATHKEKVFTIQTAKYFAKKKWLRLFFLTVNNIPVATELNLEYQGKMYGHLSGFDPAYSKYSVGHLLTLRILEECIKKGISEYDFMQGAESYKFDWTDKYRQNMNVICVNKKLSAMMICLTLKFSKLFSICIDTIKKVKKSIHI